MVLAAIPRSLRRAWPTLFVFLLLPTASAVPLEFEIEGSFAADGVRATGAIAPTGAPEQWTSWMLRSAPDRASHGRIFEADSADLQLLVWDEAQGIIASQAGPLDFVPRVPSNHGWEQRLEDVRLDLVDATGAAQAWGRTPGTSTAPTDAGASCAIRQTNGVAEGFPTIDGRTSQSLWEFHPSPGHLHADCTGIKIPTQDVRWLALYGVTLDLSSAERTERIVTGEQPSSTGTDGPRRHAILVVREPKGVMPHDLPFGTDVEIIARGFLLAGGIKVPQAVGALTWGAWEGAGVLPPLSTSGLFTLEGEETGTFGLSGRTSEARGLAAATTVSAPARGSPALVIAVAAGLGLTLIAVLWGFYARLQGPALAQQPSRASLLAFVRLHPGTTVAAAARAVGMSWTNASYHVRRLAAARLLLARDIHGQKVLFPLESRSRQDEAAICLLRHETARRLVDAVRRAPHRGQAELAVDASIDRTQASRWLRRLVEAGLLDARSERGRLHYAPTAAPTGLVPA